MKKTQLSVSVWQTNAFGAGLSIVELRENCHFLVVFM